MTGMWELLLSGSFVGEGPLGPALTPQAQMLSSIVQGSQRLLKGKAVRWVNTYSRPVDEKLQVG